LEQQPLNDIPNIQNVPNKVTSVASPSTPDLEKEASILSSTPMSSPLPTSGVLVKEEVVKKLFVSEYIENELDVFTELQPNAKLATLTKKPVINFLK